LAKLRGSKPTSPANSCFNSLGLAKKGIDCENFGRSWSDGKSGSESLRKVSLSGAVADWRVVEGMKGLLIDALFCAGLAKKGSVVAAPASPVRINVYVFII